MEDFKAKESLKLIESVIELRKRKYEENGLTLLFWGTLVAIAGIIQFIMIKMGKGAQSHLVWLFTIIPGFIVTFVVKFKSSKQKVNQNQTPDYQGWVWFFVGIIAMINGFVFGMYFSRGFMVSIYIPLCIVSLSSSISIKNNLWIVMTLLATVIVYLSVFVSITYQPLLSSVIAIVLFVIPSLNLYINFRKKNNHV